MFDRLFTLNGQLDLFMEFGMNEPLETESFREAFYDAFAMFEDAARQIGGYADVENSVRLICHDVDPATYQADALISWMAGPSPAMTSIILHRYA